MAKRDLGPEIVSLVHHVELNDSGWFKKANSRIVTGILLSLGDAASRDEIVDALELIGLSDAAVWIDPQIEQLIQQHVLIRTQDDRLKIVESTRQIMEAEVANASREAEECRRLFVALCHASCDGLDASQAWTLFSLSLSKAISQAGANTFKMLQGRNLIHAADWIQIFVKKFEEKHWSGLEVTIKSFFKSESAACRAQVLRYMSASLYQEARQVTPAVLTKLSAGSKKKKLVRIVLDTNFVFSALELHDNPANEAAKALIHLAQKPNAFLEIRLFVLPGTIEEAVQTLLIQKEKIERIRSTRTLVSAAVRAPLTSITQRFFASANASPGLTAEAFFGPYINGLKEVLKARSIHVLEASPAVYHQRQDVVDDTADELKRQERLPEARRKPYATLLHDVVFWHVVQDRRQANVTSPLEIDIWGVSIDWRFIGFDRRKRESLQLKIPTVLFPTNLVQLLQFWLPRDEDLEKSLVESLGISAFLRSFDIEDERATIRILQALSRFAELDDLPEEVIAPILANQVLRARLRDGDLDDSRLLELINQELIAEVVAARDSAAELQSRLAITTASEGGLIEQTADLARRLRDEAVAREAAEGSVSHEKKLREQLETRLRKVEDQSLASDIAIRLGGEKRKVVMCYAAVACVAVACFVVGFAEARRFTSDAIDHWLAAGTCFFAAVFVFGMCAVWWIKSRSLAPEWAFVPRARWAAKGAGVLLLVTLVGICKDFVSEHIRGQVPKESSATERKPSGSN